MFGTLRGRILIILAILTVSVVYLYRNGLKLGLDLQGGMHLAMEVADPDGTMTAEAKADATDRALKIVRTRIDEFGVEEPLVQKVGDDRIIVELAGVRDRDRAKQVIQRAAFLEFKLVSAGREFQDLADALPRIDRAVVAALGPQAADEDEEEAAPDQRESVQELLFRRGQDTTAADSAARAQGDTAAAATGDTAAAQTDTALAAGAGQRPLTSLLMEAGEGFFAVSEQEVQRINRYLALPQVQRLIPRGMELRWASEPAGRGAQLVRYLYALENRAFMTGDVLEDATAGRDPQYNQTVVFFNLSRRGGRIFERVTGANVGRNIAIVLDQQVFSAPEIRQRIGNRGQIEMGQSPLEEAQDLALVLRAGALPAPLRIIEQREVGPSLGADSVQQGKIAGIVGVTLVVLIMILVYHLSGFLAVLGLAAYIVVVLGGLAAFNATLTAPGIAGFILSIGMAVDGNVLIFERIREELDRERTNLTAAETGFKNAMAAIIDTHLTTLITALILYNVGTGPVQGFAVTLSVGIIASFFSSVFVTRTLFLLYLSRKRPTEPISI